MYTFPAVPLRVISSPSLIVTFPTVNFFLIESTFISPAPTTQHIPQPLATRAAWEVIPPLEVKIATEALIPSTSSGFVSSLTNTTFSPFAAQSTASCAVKTAFPVAPPGPAGKPFARRLVLFSTSGSTIGCNNSSSCEGVTLVIAVFSSILFSFTISEAIRIAAGPFLFPILHCSIHNFPD